MGLGPYWGTTSHPDLPVFLSHHFPPLTWVLIKRSNRVGNQSRKIRWVNLMSDLGIASSLSWLVILLYCNLPFWMWNRNFLKVCLLEILFVYSGQTSVFFLSKNVDIKEVVCHSRSEILSCSRRLRICNSWVDPWSLSLYFSGFLQLIRRITLGKDFKNMSFEDY